jgi:hypothetical protein
VEGLKGAKVVSHGRYIVFQMAEVAIPRQMFQEILRLIAELRPAATTSASVTCLMGMRSQEGLCPNARGKWPRPPRGLPEVLVSRPHLASALQERRKRANIHARSQSSGEFRLITLRTLFAY